MKSFEIWISEEVTYTEIDSREYRLAEQAYNVGAAEKEKQILRFAEWCMDINPDQDPIYPNEYNHEVIQGNLFKYWKENFDREETE